VALVLLADKALSWVGLLPVDGLEKLLMPGENGLKGYLSEYVFQSKPRLALFWATTAVLAPIGEELFFRRLFYVGLRERYGFAKSALISSALFGVIHGAGWFPVFTKSLVISYFYEKERNLLAVIFLHSLLNILATITILLCLG
jgi:membrane protease YdiL (CAAX protease family)